MSYRNDLDALAARAAALDAEVAAKVKERDAAKVLLDEAVGRPAGGQPIRRRGTGLEAVVVVAMGALLCAGARIVARDWPLSSTQPTVVVVTPPPPVQALPAPVHFAAPPAESNLPDECQRYKRAVVHLESCDKLPIEARRALKEGFDQAEVAWRDLPAEQRPALNDACKAAADAVEQAGHATCDQ